MKGKMGLTDFLRGTVDQILKTVSGNDVGLRSTGPLGVFEIDTDLTGSMENFMKRRSQHSTSKQVKYAKGRMLL